MYCVLKSLGLVGLEPYPVSVEVDVSRGMPGFEIVGLPDAAVRESRDRVRSAVRNLGYPLPQYKVVANLAPADTRKQGAVYDLPILLALIHAAGYETLDFADTAVIGEISLAGEIRKVPGVLPMVLDAHKMGVRRIVVPAENAAEAAVAEEVEVFCASGAAEVVAFLAGRGGLRRASELPGRSRPAAVLPDLEDVKGQQEARRALEIAAAGGHNLLLAGPPGTGKSMLAGRLPSILPPLSRQEAVEATKLYSVAGMLEPGTALLSQRPFRAPHHTTSAVALAGGGPNAAPGEISLAHNGVLFLDELPEYHKNALEVLRQPLESGSISISRVRQRVEYPGRVMLVAAMNPCPCGYFGHPGRDCTCTPVARQRYIGRVSGPLLDRIDIHVEVLPVSYGEISGDEKGEPSEKVRERVCAARERQLHRFARTGVACNAMITPGMLREACKPDAAAESLLQRAFTGMGLSARGYDRILKVARTVADLEGKDEIGAGHVAQAIQLRSLDRKYWGG